MRRRVTEPQLAKVTLAAYSKFLLVAVGRGSGLLLLERAVMSAVGFIFRPVTLAL